MRFVLSLIVASLASHATASTVEVMGWRTFCCAPYWTVTSADFRVNYVNTDLPWGSEVRLRRGFTRSEFASGVPVACERWTDLEVETMTAVAPYTWNLATHRDVYWRGTSTIYTAMSFVFEIVLPDGQILWDRGIEAPMGYYEVPTPHDMRECGFAEADACSLPVSVTSGD